MPDLQALFDEHAGVAALRQDHLLRLLGHAPGHLDLLAATLTFEATTLSPRRVVPAQMLGVENKRTRTWRWAWAEELDPLPEGARAASLRLREFGRRHGLSELTEASQPIRAWHGQHLAMIASGVCGASGYHRCATDDGTRFVLLFDAALESSSELPVQRVTRLFPELLHRMPIRAPGETLLGLGRALNLRMRAEKGRIELSGPDGRLVAELDAQGKLAGLDAQISRPMQ